MLKDLKKIKESSKKKEDENFEFRSFLKCVDDPDEIDEIVQKLNEEYTSKIDCTKCANCCQTVTPILEEKDIKSLSEYLKISNDEFVEKYLIKDDEGDLIFNKQPCPLLKNNLCSCYSHRPEACKSYPHLHKDGFTFRLLSVISNCYICPIAYNVFERLKGIVWK